MSLMFLASMMMAQAPAEAQAVPVQPAAAAEAKPEKEKKICRVDTSDSTSRLRKRVCMTESEWDRAESGKSVNDLKNIGAR
ncbi:MAG: hypothetical protein ACJ8FO_01175 [Sphingomicrobium sp.]